MTTMQELKKELDALKHIVLSNQKELGSIREMINTYLKTYGG